MLRFVAGSVLLLWLPGYAWSRVLLPRLTRLERVAYSIVLSVALVAAFLYVGNITFGLRISAESGALSALVLTASAGVPLLARALRARLDRWSS